MPGTKRKASFAFPYERPSKLSKRTSSITVSRTLSTITKKTSVVKPPLKMPKFPSLKAARETVEMTEESESIGGSPTPPVLRRASTLTLSDKCDSAKTSPLTKRTSSSKPTSLSKKSSSFVEEGTLVTKLSGLRSGSIVGETSLAASTSLTKESSASKSLSRKSSSVRSTGSSSKIPSLPRGLTKLALKTGDSKPGSFHITKSKLVSDIDETEMTSALESLRTRLSKEGSKKRSSLSKSASVRSTSSKKGADKDEHTKEDMDTATSSTADDITEASGHGKNGVMEIVISFDTTGSMYVCLAEVRAKVQDLVQRLQTDIPGIRVAVIAHGDYCDENNYVIKWIDFGASLPEICDFVNTVGPTGGGDGPECYELVLQRSREVLSWTEDSKRVLVMISDDVPHEPGYMHGGKTYYINWRDECAALRDMGVKIYGVQAGYPSTSTTNFNEEMARITGGKRLTLKNFACVFDVLMMICYREGNPEMLAVYEQEIIDRGERMADDITSLKKTFDMPSMATPFIPVPFPGKRPRIRDKKVAKKKVKKPDTKKAVANKSTTKATPFTPVPFPGKPPLSTFVMPSAATRFIPSPFPGKPPFGTFGMPSTATPFIPPPFPGKPPLGTFGMPSTATPFIPPSFPGKPLFGTFGMPSMATPFIPVPLPGKPPLGKAKKLEKVNLKKSKMTVKLREKLPDSCMASGSLRNFTWSKWICAVEPTLPKSKKKANFVKLRTNQGYGPNTIFDNNFKVPAIYEVAVQTPGSRKKNVVYFRMSKGGFACSGHWATNLLKHKEVRTGVNNVLKQGCSVYIRRALPKAESAAEKRSQMLAANNLIRDSYDYAWKNYKCRRSDVGVSKFGLTRRHLEIKRKGQSFTL